MVRVLRLVRPCATSSGRRGDACSERGTNPRCIKVIVTQFDAVADQNRHEFVVSRFQQGIGVNVDDFHLRAEFDQQRLERGTHVVA